MSDTFGSSFNQVTPNSLEKIRYGRTPSAPGWRCHVFNPVLAPSPCQIDEFHFGSDLRKADNSKYKLKVRLLDDRNRGIVRKKKQPVKTPQRTKTPSKTTSVSMKQARAIYGAAQQR
jgi:hypothetical protein